MKTYKHLFEKIITLENIHLAIDKASKGKTKRASVARVLRKRDFYAREVRARLLGHKPLLKPTHTRLKSERGKLRELHISPFYPNQIIHHALANIIEPLLAREFNTQTCACIKGRGVDYGIKRAKRYVKGYTYYLQFDIQKFYANIGTELLLAQMRKRIKCDKTLELLASILASCKDASGKGLGLGNYLSAFLGNYYVKELDYTHDKRVRSLRYADDIIAFSDSKRALWGYFYRARAILTRLGLRTHKVRVSESAKGLDFLGVKMYQTHTLVRKSNAQAIKRLARLKHIGARSFARVFSYYGFLARAHCFNLFSKVLRVIKSKIKAYCKRAKIHYPLHGLCFYRREPRLFRF